MLKKKKLPGGNQSLAPKSEPWLTHAVFRTNQDTPAAT